MNVWEAKITELFINCEMDPLQGKTTLLGFWDELSGFCI